MNMKSNIIQYKNPRPSILAYGYTLCWSLSILSPKKSGDRHLKKPISYDIIKACWWGWNIKNSLLIFDNWFLTFIHWEIDPVNLINEVFEKCDWLRFSNVIYLCELWVIQISQGLKTSEKVVASPKDFWYNTCITNWSLKIESDDWNSSRRWVKTRIPKVVKPRAVTWSSIPLKGILSGCVYNLSQTIGQASSFLLSLCDIQVMVSPFYLLTDVLYFNRSVPTLSYKQ